MVVATWGFPGNWLKERYSAAVPPANVDKWHRLSEWSIGGYVEAHSPTPVEAKALSEMGFDVGVVVYALDSLSAVPRLSVPSDDDVRGKLVEELNKYVDGWLNKDPEGYGEVRGRAEKVAGLFVSGYFGEVGFPLDKVSTVVLPGTGVYALGPGSKGKRYVFRGSPQNAAVAMELDLLERVDAFKPDAVVFDSTHGINYLPIVAKRVVERVARVYSALEGRKVCVATVQSDTPAGGLAGLELGVMVVDVKVFSASPREVLEELLPHFDSEPYRMLKKDEKVKPPDSLKELRKEFGELKEVKPLAKALVELAGYGLTLYLCSKVRELAGGDFSSMAGRLLERVRGALYERDVASGGEVRVEHVYAFSDSVPGVLEAVYVLGRVVPRLAELCGVDEQGFMGVDRLLEVGRSLGLTRLGERLLGYEVSDVKRRVSAARDAGIELEGRVVPYAAVYDAVEGLLRKEGVGDSVRREAVEKFKEILGRGVKCDVDARNFYAHAGLERNVVEVKVQGGSVYVRYREECMENVRSVVEKG